MVEWLDEGIYLIIKTTLITQAHPPSKVLGQ
jgi:hypothetical protein